MQHDVTYSWMWWEGKGTAALHRQEHFYQGVNPGSSESESLSRSKAKLPPETTGALQQFFSLFLLSVYFLRRISYHLQYFVSLKGLKTQLKSNQVLPVAVNPFSLV